MMKRFMDRIWELIQDEKSKHFVPLYDEATPKGISYGQLGDISGRVYSYLKARAIGKEDFVMIKLPRGVLPLLAMIGVWRAGAAFVLVEDTLAPERIDFMYKDCGCKLAITSEVWEEILQCKPLDGYEKTDPHDAAFAVYTSGTTGNPKGVLHEYGNLERCIESFKYEGVHVAFPGARFGLAAPMHFVPSIMVSFYILYTGYAKNFIISYPTVRNPVGLIKFLLTKKINVFFLTPTYAKKFKGRTGPFMKIMIVGSEPANHFYLKGVRNINMYSQTESAIVTAMFNIDREYDVCPVGKPQIDIKHRIVDDNGNDVPDGEIGEFIFENPYVRGYINQPEATAETFKNGYFYTSDLAQVLPDGNIVICGRKNDMIKINGNRIEPAEIEAAIQSILKIDWCAARGFVSDEQSFICAYYKDDISFDADELRAQLQKRLPHYMIPAYFMKIDSIPVRPNGKMDRSALPKPEVKNIARTYREPANEIESVLCRAMQKVLRVERVGADDDFYEMGGDSLSSMELLVESGLPGLDVGSIFRGRSAAKIAQLYMEQIKNRDPNGDEARNDSAKREEHRLTPEQADMFYYQSLVPNTTMYNLFKLTRLDKNQIDPARMAAAVEMAIKNHPSLRTVLKCNEKGELIQKYDPDMPIGIIPEKISEKELEEQKGSLVAPFTILNAPLFRCRLFETEAAVYLFFDVHHIIFDGTSLNVFMNSVINAYLGTPLETDYYYLVLARREQMELTDFYKEGQQYYEKTYGNVKWTTCPKIDRRTSENKLGFLTSYETLTSAHISSVEKKFMVSRNELFLAATLLAIAISTGKNDVQASWIYNGRDDLASASSVGLLFRELSVALRLRDDADLHDIFAEIHDQVRNGIKYSCYPYIASKRQAVGEDVACVVYQRDLLEAEDFDGIRAEDVEIPHNNAAAQSILDIQILDGEDGLQYEFDYAASHYNESTMIDFLSLMRRTVSAIVQSVNTEIYTFRQLKHDVSVKKSLGARLRNLFRKK